MSWARAINPANGMHQHKKQQVSFVHLLCTVGFYFLDAFRVKGKVG